MPSLSAKILALSFLAARTCAENALRLLSRRASAILGQCGPPKKVNRVVARPRRA
jgi:4'-phosphopantetheinyl transferase EntD